MQVKQRWDCDKNAVFVTTNFQTTHEFGRGQFPKYRDNPTVYKITKLPKKCKVEADLGMTYAGSYKIKGCGCVKPQFKCRVDTSTLYGDLDNSGYLPDDWEDQNCKWEKA